MTLGLNKNLAKASLLNVYITQFQDVLCLPKRLVR
jgi:hypothetical protein